MAGFGASNLQNWLSMADKIAVANEGLDHCSIPIEVAATNLKKQAVT
jgi:hypothetical protein